MYIMTRPCETAKLFSSPEGGMYYGVPCGYAYKLETIMESTIDRASMATMIIVIIFWFLRLKKFIFFSFQKSFRLFM